MAKLKRGPRAILLLTVAGGFFGYYYWGVHTGRIKNSVLATVIPVRTESITAPILAGSTTVKAVELPTKSPLSACVDGNTRNCVPGASHEIEVWGWNANAGLLFAAGGPQTTKGSLMAKYGVNVSIRKQDNTDTMKADLLSTAQQLANDPNAAGVKYVTIMGDGAAQFFEEINPKLAKVCPDCVAKVIATIGYSRGEDGFWGPAEWRTNPQKARGSLIIGVLRDGDWNIAMKWAAQNQIPNNPDEGTYDANAINWINAESYTKAVEMLITPGGFCAPLLVKGSLSGKKQTVCASGVVTWTPGDVTLAHQKGGLVPLLTTRESAFQMPCVLIGIERWTKSHPDEVKKLIAAIYEGGGQVRAFPAALQRAGEISAQVYQDQDAAYWVKYYKGTVEADATGVRVPLGGSMVANLADGLQSFGLNGGTNLFAAAYNMGGRYVVQQYGKLIPSYPPVSEILDTSYVQAVKAMNTLPTDNGESAAYTQSTAPMAAVQGRRDYAIQFESGRAEILPSSFTELNQLVDDVNITKYIVAAHGYTDNAKWGTAADSAERNLKLSGERAEAVKAYLAGHGVRNVIRIYQHGEEDPVADNATTAGRARNRRVQIVLGTAAGQ